MNNFCNMEDSCNTLSSPNNLEILLNQIKREIETLSKTTEAKLLLHDGKIAEMCKYIKNNLSNTIRSLLDSMMLSGELDEIITNTLIATINQKLTFCDTATKLKCSYFEVGDVVRTLGYHSINDGGGALYKIRPKMVSDLDNTSLIPVFNGSLIGELIVENEIVNVKQFGAYGDGVHDDGDAFQNVLNSGIKNIFVPKGNYLISKTLLMNANTKLYGVNEKNTTLLVDEKLKDSYIIKYLDSYSYNDSKSEISNLTFKSNTSENLSKGLYLNSGIIIKNVDFNRLKTAIVKNTSYIDQIKIERCNFYYCSGTNSSYVIDIAGNNDGLEINQIHIIDNYNKSNYSKYRGIRISTNTGGSINNSIINVPLYVVNSRGFSVNNSHFEGSQNPNFNGNLAQIEILKSDVTLNNCFIQKCIDRANILIKNEGEESKNNTYVTLNNCTVVYPSHYLELYKFSDLYDIEKDINTTLKIMNSFSTLDLSALWTQTNSKIGLRVKNCEDFNKHSSYYSIDGVIGPNNEVISLLPPIKQKSGFYNRPIFEQSFQNKYVPWFEGGFNDKSIYYAGVYVFDYERKLALFRTTNANELTLKVTTKSSNGGNGVSLKINPSKIADGLGLTLFVYRGNESRKYNRLTKVPSSNAVFIYDMGTSINGVETENRSETDVDSFNYVKKCELIGDNVIFYSDGLPNYGVFKKYDRCINTNIKSGAVKSWVYNGTSWISEGTY